jgi:hypothetical protein
MTSALALVEDAPVVEAALPARSIDPQLIATLSAHFPVLGGLKWR